MSEAAKTTAVPVDPEETAPSRWSMMMRTPGRLIAALVLIVIAVSVAVFATPTQVFSGKLNAVGIIQLGKWNGGQKHTYKFTTTFPNGTAAQDNPYKTTSTSVDFVWDAVS